MPGLDAMMSQGQNDDTQVLNQAERALMAGDFSQAAALAGEVLGRDTLNARAHLLRGVASNQLGQIERAVQDLLFVLERRPSETIAQFHLGQALRKGGNFDAALPHFRALLNDQNLRPHVLFETARSLHGLGRLQMAIDHYQLLLREIPGHGDAAANLAILLEKTDQLDSALTWAERALVLAPRNSSAGLVRAQVLRREGRFDEATAQLETLLEQELPPVNQIIATNQLAQCLDQLGRYDEAFERFSEANQLQQATDPYAEKEDYASYGIEWARYLRDWQKAHPPADWSPTPKDDRRPPVFLLGFPRSGTTQLDRILGAHRQVEVIEQQELLLEVRRKWITPENFPRLHLMNEDELSEARGLYRKALAAAYNNPDARVVIDKLPLNSLYLPLIHRLFPEARILFAVRDPRDACLGCFFQTFSLLGAMPYFLDLESTAQYYDAVMGVASEARKQLPLKLHEVRYEAVVENPEQEARNIFDFLELPWDNAVLDNRAGVEGSDIETPGFAQVAEPMVQRSSGRWRHYERQLNPVEPILRPWVEHFAYPTD